MNGATPGTDWPFRPVPGAEIMCMMRAGPVAAASSMRIALCVFGVAANVNMPSAPILVSDSIGPPNVPSVPPGTEASPPSQRMDPPVDVVPARDRAVTVRKYVESATSLNEPVSVPRFVVPGLPEQPAGTVPLAARAPVSLRSIAP